MEHRPVTVSDLADLISAREETRAELRALAQEAFEQWRSLEAKLSELEARFDSSCGEISEVKLRVAPVLPAAAGDAAAAVPEPE